MIKHYDKVIILTKDDTYINLEQWQHRYGLPVGSSQIGKHFSFNEFKFNEDIERYGKLIVCEPLMMIMDPYRELKGKPVSANSYNRDDAKQAELTEGGFRTATSSPHVEKMAIDMDTISVQDTHDQVKLLRIAALDTGIPHRIGFQQYLDHFIIKDGKKIPMPQTFIHLDVAPLYYGKGGPRHQEQHPGAWEINKLEW
jgi:hypothetical protein